MEDSFEGDASVEVPSDAEGRGYLCILGGTNGREGFLAIHMFRNSASTEGRPAMWSWCQCERIMSETSGFVRFDGDD